MQSSAQPLPTSPDDACPKFFVLVRRLPVRCDPDARTIFSVFLAISVYNFFSSIFFFNDPFADITLVCKQLQNETGIFNLQMGVPSMSKKAEHSTIALVFISSLFFFFFPFLSPAVFE